MRMMRVPRGVPKTGQFRTMVSNNLKSHQRRRMPAGNNRQNHEVSKGWLDGAHVDEPLILGGRIPAILPQRRDR